MIKHLLRLLGLIQILLWSYCSIQPPPTPLRPSPHVRVGLVENVSQIEFSTDTGFEITTRDGSVLGTGDPGVRWRAEVLQSIPGHVVYRLVAGSMKSKQSAREKAREVEALGYKTEIRPVGRPLMVGNRFVKTRRLYRILLGGNYQDRDTASLQRDAVWNRLETFVSRQSLKRPKGLLCLTNLRTGQEIKSTDPIRLTGSAVTLYNIPVGAGFHWEHKEDRTYPEQILFDLDAEGQLAVINDIPLEVYIQGVIPSEMPAGFPLEALKAQAIAARGKALGNWGISHEADPYDVCATVHCQVYSGLSKRDPRTDRAAKETSGLIMRSDGDLLDAIFGAVCGGHSESVDLAWGGSPHPSLEGRLDGPNALARYGPLTVESNVRRWIDDSPNAFCNSTVGTVPAALDYTKKYFRWEKVLTPMEIEEALEQQNKGVGRVLEIFPLERGRSGRIIQLKVIGSNGESLIHGELNIRRALSTTTLWSSCFYVTKESNVFIFKGAGWGHGVGMCQTGAAGMALRGKKAGAILTHFYKDIEIDRLY